MNRVVLDSRILSSWRSLVLSLALLAGLSPSVAQPPPASTSPEVKSLGGDRYRVGAIDLNKAERRFSVPGVVTPVDGPLEYLAVTKGGMKNYESLLELDVNAFEFNLACILIGLDAERARLPEFHFDPAPVSGDPVRISVRWTRDGNATEVAGETLILEGSTPSKNGDWRYTGSLFSPDNAYLAAQDGTLIGFVHDPASVIEHRLGLGLGNYGAVTANRGLLPPAGTGVTLTVEVLPAPQDAPRP